MCIKYTQISLISCLELNLIPISHLYKPEIKIPKSKIICGKKEKCFSIYFSKCFTEYREETSLTKTNKQSIAPLGT